MILTVTSKSAHIAFLSECTPMGGRHGVSLTILNFKNDAPTGCRLATYRPVRMMVLQYRGNTHLHVMISPFFFGRYRMWSFRISAGDCCRIRHLRLDRHCIDRRRFSLAPVGGQANHCDIQGSPARLTFGGRFQSNPDYQQFLQRHLSTAQTAVDYDPPVAPTFVGIEVRD
jgi:hypothetical protein